MANIQFQLTIEGGDETQVVDLKIGTTTIGRIEGNDLILPHNFVSSRHAKIDCTDSACILTDLGSTNGTIVNGDPLPANTPVPLTEKTSIRIGPYNLAIKETQGEVDPDEERVPFDKAFDKTAEPEKPTPKKPRRRKSTTQPPSPPQQPPPTNLNGHGSIFEPNISEPPPGMTVESQRLLSYLPGIYHTDFMARFLGIFESILTPIEWTVDNFDLYLRAGTAPREFLPWLANWYDIVLDDTWSEEQRRTLLAEAHHIFARRGTKGSLNRVLEIYTGREPVVSDLEDEDEPFSFTVRVPVRQSELNPELVERIIDANKPAHTTYKLLFKK